MSRVMPHNNNPDDMEDLGPVDEAEGRRNGKSETAFRTISEVAEELDIPQHVLRFWETKFSQIRPMKRGGGRRYYRPEDVALLRRIRGLLYEDGFTIKGVQQLLKDGAITPPAPGEDLHPEDPPPAPLDLLSAVEQKVEEQGGLYDWQRHEIEAVIEDLTAVRDMLHPAGRGRAGRL